MADKDICPACKNEERFYLHVSSFGGSASLLATGIGSVSLCVCSKCGCTYVEKSVLKKYKELKESGFYG